MVSYSPVIVFLVNVLRILLLKTVMDVFLSAEDTEKRPLKTGFGIYCLLTTAVYGIAQVSVVYELCNCLGIFGLTCFYQDTWKKRLWVSLVLFSMDMASSLIVLFAFGDTAKFLQPAVQALLLLICTTMVSRISDPPEAKEIAFDRKQTFLLLVIPAMSVLILSVLMPGKLERMSAILICGCVLMTNISAFYLYHVLIENYINLRAHDRYRQQTYAYQNQLEVIMESQSRVRALRHDLKNHMLALQVLVERKELEEANRYIDSMKNFMANPQEYVKTGNDTVDSLLNYKLRKANEVLHVVETNIRIPERLNLRSFDLNVLLGNLLDNAIDASVQTEDKKLKIAMKIDKGILFLNIRNSCRRIDGGRKNFLETTKGDHVNHGIGLLNVRRIVEKYHGEIEFFCENDLMETDVMMYVKEL